MSVLTLDKTTKSRQQPASALVVKGEARASFGHKLAADVVQAGALDAAPDQVAPATTGTTGAVAPPKDGLLIKMNRHLWTAYGWLFGPPLSASDRTSAAIEKGRYDKYLLF